MLGNDGLFLEGILKILGVILKMYLNIAIYILKMFYTHFEDLLMYILKIFWIFLVTQILPQHKPSCILSQHEVIIIICYTCTVERLVDASPFFLLLDSSLFETLFIYPCTML